MISSQWRSTGVSLKRGDMKDWLLRRVQAGEACVVLNGTMASRACRTALSLHASSTQSELYYAKAIRYTLMITVLSFIQVRFET